MSNRGRQLYLRALAKHGPLPVGVSRVLKTYFIQGKITGLVKIGRTHGSVKQRVKELQPTSPDELQILKWVRADIEGACHFQFRQHHVRNEWFRPHSELMKFISLL
jgi:hypothetical protein